MGSKNPWAPANDCNCDDCAPALLDRIERELDHPIVDGCLVAMVVLSIILLAVGVL
jgi:hypothetical protein